jgi:hypothetical protein
MEADGTTEVTAVGHIQTDGKVIVKFSGTPATDSPIKVEVADGNMTATPTSTLANVGTNYATTAQGEPSAVGATTTVPGMTAAAANNDDGTVTITLTGAPTATGTYTVTANAGSEFTLSNGAVPSVNQTGNYSDGESVIVTLEDKATGLPPVGGMTAVGTGQSDGSLQVVFTGNPTTPNTIEVTPEDGVSTLAQTNLSGVGSGYNSAEALPTLTVTDPNGKEVTGTSSVTSINGNGSLEIDISGVNLTATSPAGNYSVVTSAGTMATLQTINLNGIGSGYSLAEPTAPSVTVTDPLGANLPGAVASINSNGTINVDLSSITLTAANPPGPYTIDVASGVSTGVQNGLDD